MGSPEDFAGMIRLVKANVIRPVLDTSYPLAEVSEALLRMERGENFGKIVLTIPPA
ncbi:hypothetical protein D3C72_2363090 [compost metagenome]